MFALVQLTREAAVVVAGNARWMAWNVVLALVPLVLAVRLFRGGGVVRDRWWWAGVVAFVLFLPNAPYVLTDIIHLFTDVRAVQSDAVLSFAVVPQYGLFFLVGFLSYAASFVLLSDYVGERSMRWMRLVLHGMSAVGIYLGRYVRLNSWDALVRPWDVARAVWDSLSLRGALAFGLAFGTLLVLTDAAMWAWSVRRRLAT